MSNHGITGKTAQQSSEGVKETARIDTGQQKPVRVESLPGRVCYFSLAGNLALKAFDELVCSAYNGDERRDLLKQNVEKRLHFAAIMFDTVVMHCSDPLRSEIILEILEEHSEWVKEGKILFIFSSKINNIRRDYRAYILKKRGQYRKGGYRTKTEADSLDCPFMTDEYYERVISLLEKTPKLVRKTKAKNFSFDSLVLDDLNQYHSDRIFVDSHSDLSQILTLDLSLHQLLTIRILSIEDYASDCKAEYAFSSNDVDAMTDAIRTHLKQGSVIARSAIVDSLTSTAVPANNRYKRQKQAILSAITLRMDVLYCRMNSGKHLILEFHPSYERHSIYQADCFFEYLSHIAGDDVEIELGKELVQQLCSDENINLFRVLYLAYMADTKELLNLTLSKSHNEREYKQALSDCFCDILEDRRTDFINSKFDSIRKLLRGEKHDNN